MIKKIKIIIFNSIIHDLTHLSIKCLPSLDPSLKLAMLLNDGSTNN